VRKNPPRFLADKRVRFLIVGGVNTLWGIAAYPLLYVVLNPLGVNYLVTLVLAYAVSIAFSFTTQKYLVFRTKGKHVRELSKFLGLQCVILVLNLIALPALVIATGWNPLIIQVILSIVIAVISYFFHNHVTFRSQPQSAQDKETDTTR
jgi:putative flippase GtrA